MDLNVSKEILAIPGKRWNDCSTAFNVLVSAGMINAATTLEEFKAKCRQPNPPHIAFKKFNELSDNSFKANFGKSIAKAFYNSTPIADLKDSKSKRPSKQFIDSTIKETYVFILHLEFEELGSSCLSSLKDPPVDVSRTDTVDDQDDEQDQHDFNSVDFRNHPTFICTYRSNPSIFKEDKMLVNILLPGAFVGREFHWQLVNDRLLEIKYDYPDFFASNLLSRSTYKDLSDWDPLKQAVAKFQADLLAKQPNCTITTVLPVSCSTLNIDLYVVEVG